MSKQPESFYAHRRIGFIPLDARPVCYDLPKQLAAMSGLELVCPTQRLLGRTVIVSCVPRAISLYFCYIQIYGR